MNSFYSEEELKEIGFKSYGENVQISRNASIYGADKISIGNNVRIDDFCVISGNISLGNYIHIAAFCGLFGGNAGIEIHDYSTTSSKCSIYALSDDYSGEYMTNPTIPDRYKNVTEKKVIINKHSIIGTGTTILPGVTISEGCSVGSMSLVNKSLDSWGIYAGIPCRKIKDRSKHLLELEQEFIKNL